MKKKKTLVAIIALLLVVVVGATFAYFQTSASFENVFNTGTYKFVTTEVFESPDNWKPGEEIPKTITTKNEGTIPAAVRVSLTEKWEDSEGNDISSQVDVDNVIINFDNQDEWTKEGDYYYYKYFLEPGDTTSSFIKSVTLNSNINGVSCTESQDGKGQRCTTTSSINKYSLTITKETVQYDAYKEIWGDSVPNIVETPISYVYTGIGDGENKDGLITSVSEGNSNRPDEYIPYLRYRLIKEKLNCSGFDVCMYNETYGEICLDNDSNEQVIAKRLKKYFNFNSDTWNFNEENNSWTSPDSGINCEFSDINYCWNTIFEIYYEPNDYSITKHEGYYHDICGNYGCYEHLDK